MNNVNHFTSCALLFSRHMRLGDSGTGLESVDINLEDSDEDSEDIEDYRIGHIRRPLSPQGNPPSVSQD